VSRRLPLSIGAACAVFVSNVPVTCFDDVGMVVSELTFRRCVAYDERLGKVGTTMTHRNCCLNSGEVFPSGPNIWAKMITNKFRHIVQCSMNMQPWCTGSVSIPME
jgi:hypothetical protein